MKKIIMLLVTLVIGIGAICQAYEIAGNPDRKLSFGFTFDKVNTKGDFESKVIRVADAGKFDQDNYKLDVRAPIASWITLNFGGGYSKTNIETSNFVLGDGYFMSGYNLSAGVRLYLP